MFKRKPAKPANRSIHIPLGYVVTTEQGTQVSGVFASRAAAYRFSTVMHTQNLRGYLVRAVLA